MNAKRFGNRIQYYRKQQGLTQGELGERLGVSQVTIAHYEKGSRFPKGSKLKGLASELNVSIDSLMGLGEDLSDSGESRHDRDELIRILSEESLERGWLYLRGWQSSRGYDGMDVFLKILIPLLRRVGDLWSEKKLLVSHEHIISEKVKHLIDRLTREELEAGHILPDRSRRWMGLCAPGEQHELVLFMISQIMRLSGWEVRYLGRDVPPDDLKRMVRLYKPDLLVFSITMESHRKELEGCLENLAPLSGKTRIMVGGRGWTEESASPFPQVDYVESLEDYRIRMGNNGNGSE